MVFTAARASRKVAVRLTAMTLSQSSSRSCTNRLSRLTPALATRMSSLPIASSALRHQRLDRILVGEIAGQHVHALLQFAGQRIERLAPGAGKRDRRALPVQRAAMAAAERAACAGHQRGLAGQIEHHGVFPRRLTAAPRQPRAALNAATSSGVPMALARRALGNALDQAGQHLAGADSRRMS